MGSQVHDGDAVQMVGLMADAPGQHTLGLNLEGVAVPVKGAGLHPLGPGDLAVAAGERQAALVQGNHLVGLLQNFRVHELDELQGRGILLPLGDVPLVNADEHPAHYPHLRAGQAVAVGVGQGFLHVVQQGSQTVVKLGHRAADLFQNGIAVLYNITQSHN